jgi:hypothetical protein
MSGSPSGTAGCEAAGVAMGVAATADEDGPPVATGVRVGSAVPPGAVQAAALAAMSRIVPAMDLRM